MNADTVTGSVLAAHDISDRKRAEERQQLLVRELHHRVKNTLATVQAISGSTMRSARSMEEFRDSFAQRLMSLGKTHTLLTENAWGGALLEDLLWLELDPYDDDTGGRVKLAGPSVQLPAELSVPLGMAFHELTTNAVKYGALSVFGGQVEVAWDVQAEGTESRLHLVWQERNGPPVQPPKRRGFGTQLLQRVLGTQLNGEVKIDYAPEGVHVLIEATLPSSALEQTEAPLQARSGSLGRPPAAISRSGVR
jgi:two-component sensor histidine kinase